MTKTVLARKFNAAGLELFRKYVLLKKTSELPPEDLLFAEVASEPLDVKLEVQPLATDSKYDLGMLIVTNVDEADVPSLLADPMVWPWLSLYFSNRTMPVRKGERFIGHEQRHIITNASGWSTYDRGHRHLVRAAVQSVLYFGEFARVLTGTVSEHSKPEENILSRKSLYPLAYMKNAVEAFYRMYYDPSTGRARKGAASTGPGGIIDFVRSLGQLDVNYDVASLPAARILELLPTSFASSKAGTASTS